MPRGILCRGQVIESEPPGRLTGHPTLSLSLDIDLQGCRYEVITSHRALASEGHATPNAIWISGGTGCSAGRWWVGLIGAGGAAVASTQSP